MTAGLPPSNVPANDPAALRTAFGHFATGVTLVTITTGDGPMGFVANSFTSLSLDPPLVLWCPAKTSLRFSRFAAAEHFVIHVLERRQRALLARFVRGGAGFDALDHTANPEGVPILGGVLARYDCTRFSTHDGGDHVVIVGRVLRWATGHGAPLVFSQGRYGTFADPDPAIDS
jgi:flavin reductase (DIM6/NTAB) family NADH-FMN oxidoreductase RutF